MKTLDLRKTNFIHFKKVSFCWNSTLYVLKTLDYGKTNALRFVNVNFLKKPSLYALKTLNLKLTLPSFLIMRGLGWWLKNDPPMLGRGLGWRLKYNPPIVEPVWGWCWLWSANLTETFSGSGSELKNSLKLSKKYKSNLYTIKEFFCLTILTDGTLERLGVTLEETSLLLHPYAIE